MAGAFSRSVTNPLERLKILRQLGIQDYKGVGLGKSLMKMGRTEGWRGYMKGT